MGDTYILKRCPKTGHLHYPESESDGGISTAAQAICSANALAERTDGKVVHNLAFSLSTIEQVTGITLAAAPPPRSDGPRAKRKTMTLRGFLNLLWDEPGLHASSQGTAGKRNLGRVYWGLRNQLADRLIGGDEATAGCSSQRQKSAMNRTRKRLPS